MPWGRRDIVDVLSGKDGGAPCPIISRHGAEQTGTIQLDALGRAGQGVHLENAGGDRRRQAAQLQTMG